MRIGILGTGNMADALGARWARAGHEVFVGGRDAARAAEVAGRIGAAGAGGLRAAAEFGTGAVLLAVPYEAAVEVIAGLEVPLRGRVLVDCCNPVGPGFVLLTRAGLSAAGDSEDALAVVRQLVRALGCEPLNAGGLDRAGLLEATAALLIGLWVGEGADAQAIAPPLEFAQPVPQTC